MGMSGGVYTTTSYPPRELVRAQQTIKSCRSNRPMRKLDVLCRPPGSQIEGNKNGLQCQHNDDAMRRMSFGPQIL